MLWTAHNLDVRTSRAERTRRALPSHAGRLVPSRSRSSSDLPRTSNTCRQRPRRHPFRHRRFRRRNDFEATSADLLTRPSRQAFSRNFVIPNQAVDDHGDTAVGMRIRCGEGDYTECSTRSSIRSSRADRASAVTRSSIDELFADQRLGDVRAHRFPASPSGERILDALARAPHHSRALTYRSHLSRKDTGLQASRSVRFSIDDQQHLHSFQRH